MKWFKASVLAIICVCFVTPLVWMLAGSFTPMVGIMKMPPSLVPAHATVENYARVLAPGVAVLRWLLNSVIITVATVAGSVITTGAAAYAIAVYRFKWTRVVYLAFAATMMISRYSLLIPMFVLVRTYHLSGLPAVILTGVFYPLGFFLFFDFMKRIPHDFVESARIDGAGEWRIFWQVMMPLCKPILGAVMAFKTMEAFGDYIWQMLILQGENEKTYIVGLISRIYEEYVYTRLANHGIAMAVGVLAFLPLLFVYLWTNRYFLEGVTLGGVKE